jgi:iron(III) transport system ATP-binding protein
VSHLVLSGLTKQYGTQTVLDSIDLSVAQGQLVCLLGPSGCGKTTTLRLVAGFMEPTAGTVHVGGRELSRPGNALPPERRGMSMIFQSYALWPHMTIFENVAYGLALRKFDKAEIAKRVAKMLGAVKLEHLAERYPGELSGGQQQRVAIARAIAKQPDVLLCDEPTGALDSKTGVRVLEALTTVSARSGATTLVITHSAAIAAIADRVVHFANGAIAREERNATRQPASAVSW